MSLVHPNLCLRSVPNPNLKRPTREHQILGRLEYINRDGGWWQSTNRLDGMLVRVDVQFDMRVTAQELDASAELLTWTQQNISMLRSFAKRELANGTYRIGLVGGPHECYTDGDVVDSLRPYLIVIWSDSVSLDFECDHFPEGCFSGKNVLSISANPAMTNAYVNVFSNSIDGRAKTFLDREVPSEMCEFVNSLPDRFICRMASSGVRGIDAELQPLLLEAIRELDQRWTATTSQATSFLRSARLLLNELSKSTETTVFGQRT